MPLPQFASEQSGNNPVPLEALTPPSSGVGDVAAFKSGVVTSLVASGITQLKGATGDQTFVPHDDAAKEMQANGYDPSVLPQNGTTRAYLDALQQQQSAIARNKQIADQAGLKYSAVILPSVRGVAEFAGGNAADSPLFILGGGAAGLGLRAAGLETVESIGARAAVRGAEGSALAGGYDVARKQFGTVPGDKDLGLYDIGRDMMIGGVLGAGFGAMGPKNIGERNLAANNPGNLRVPGKMEFQKFGSLDEGVAAVGHQLNLYRERGINTIEKIVNTYAPASDHNNVAAYVDDVSKRSGIDPNAVLTDADVAKVRDAMIEHEQGPGWKEKAETFGRRTGDQGESFRTNPARIAAEHAGEVSNLETQGFQAAQDKLASRVADLMADHVSDSSAPSGTRPIWQEPDTEAAVTRAQSQPQESLAPKAAPSEEAVPPDVADMQKQAIEAVTDAKAMHIAANPEGNTEAFDAHMKEAQDSVMPMVEQEKAVEAALNCPLLGSFE